MMRKFTALFLASVCVLGLAGCQKTIRGSELYAFPEPTMLITGSFYAQGRETAFEIGSESYDPHDLSAIPVISWFYDLELTPCEEPEPVEGAESYTFRVGGRNGFYL